MIRIPYPDETKLNAFYNMHKSEILRRVGVIKHTKKIQWQNKTYKLTKKIVKIIDEFENEEKLKNILIGKPNELIKIITKYKYKYEEPRFKNKGVQIFYNLFYNEKKDIDIFLRSIFEKYGYDQIDKLQFIKNIDLKTCPYCNRNYTFTIDEKGSVKPELDHFYPKSLYPFLACSFFNLIPSCPTCNGFGAKESKDTYYVYPITNPYELKTNDFKFSITPNNINFFNVESEKYDFNSFEINLYGNKVNLEVFKLEELYKQHKDIVLELLIKKVYYPKSYINELQTFGFSQDEIYRYLLCNYNKEEDLHKRPLSKLVKDISEELGLIKS